MAKKTVYYWRGPGELLGCKSGEKVPTEKMGKDQLAKMIGDGRIQETAFDIAEDTGVVADLKKKVKALSAKIVELNGSDDKAKIAELEDQIKADGGECEKCKELEADAKKFYNADGTVTDCETAEEVVELRKEAAAKIADLEKQLEDATDPDAGSGD